MPVGPFLARSLAPPNQLAYLHTRDQETPDPTKTAMGRGASESLLRGSIKPTPSTPRPESGTLVLLLGSPDGSVTLLPTPGVGRCLEAPRPREAFGFIASSHQNQPGAGCVRRRFEKCSHSRQGAAACENQSIDCPQLCRQAAAPQFCKKPARPAVCWGPGPPFRRSSNDGALGLSESRRAVRHRLVKSLGRPQTNQFNLRGSHFTLHFTHSVRPGGLSCVMPAAGGG